MADLSLFAQTLNLSRPNPNAGIAGMQAGLRLAQMDRENRLLQQQQQQAELLQRRVNQMFLDISRVDDPAAQVSVLQNYPDVAAASPRTFQLAASSIRDAHEFQKNSAEAQAKLRQEQLIAELHAKYGLPLGTPVYGQDGFPTRAGIIALDRYNADKAREIAINEFGLPGLPNDVLFTTLPNGQIDANLLRQTLSRVSKLQPTTTQTVTETGGQVTRKSIEPEGSNQTKITGGERIEISKLTGQITFLEETIRQAEEGQGNAVNVGGVDFDVETLRTRLRALKSQLEVLKEGFREGFPSDVDTGNTLRYDINGNLIP